MNDQNGDHISIPAFLAELDLDQLDRCRELAQQRMDGIKATGKVQVWEVSDGSMNYYGTQDYLAAVDTLARKAREMFTKSGYTDNWYITERFIYQAELADYLANWT